MYALAFTRLGKITLTWKENVCGFKYNHGSNSRNSKFYDLKKNKAQKIFFLKFFKIVSKIF